MLDTRCWMLKFSTQSAFVPTSATESGLLLHMNAQNLSVQNLILIVIVILILILIPIAFHPKTDYDYKQDYDYELRWGGRTSP